MVYKSFNARTRKLNTIWQQAEINNTELTENNNFKPITVEEVISSINKIITRVQLIEPPDNIWFGSVSLEGFTEQMLEYVYPVAVFKATDPNISTKDIEIFDGSLYYWFNKINENTYFLRFAVDANIDLASFGLNFSLVFFNKRIYDNLQKSKQ